MRDWSEPLQAYAVISKEGGEESASDLTPSVPLGQKQGALPAGTEHSGDHILMVPVNRVYTCVNEIQRCSLCLSKRYPAFQRDEYHPEEAE